MWDCFTYLQYKFKNNCTVDLLIWYKHFKFLTTKNVIQRNVIFICLFIFPVELNGLKFALIRKSKGTLSKSRRKTFDPIEADFPSVVFFFIFSGVQNTEFRPPLQHTVRSIDTCIIFHLTISHAQTWNHFPKMREKRKPIEFVCAYSENNCNEHICAVYPFTLPSPYFYLCLLFFLSLNCQCIRILSHQMLKTLRTTKNVKTRLSAQKCDLEMINKTKQKNNACRI